MIIQIYILLLNNNKYIKLSLYVKLHSINFSNNMFNKFDTIILIISIAPFAWFYLKSFKIVKYYTYLQKEFFLWYYVFILITYIFILILLLIIDVVTTSDNRNLLFLKEQIGITYLFIFVIHTLLLFPILLYKQGGNKNVLLTYYFSLIGANIINLLQNNHSDDNLNYGFNTKLPESLSKYCYINNWKYKIMYFNFGLSMALGKFLGFTYMPFGMSSWTSQFIFYDDEIQKEKNNLITKENNITKEKDDNNEEKQKLLTESETMVLKHNNRNQKKKSGIYLLQFFGILCFILIVLILFTKIIILYSKIFYNICGIQCGLLSYRFDHNKFNLETIISYINYYTYPSKLHPEIFILILLLCFRLVTIIHSFKIKGISFLNTMFISHSQEMKPIHIIILSTTFVFTVIVMLYDFTYLLPDYMRFNNLDPLCDYTTLGKSYCGVSYFGLLFAKISLNYQLFMIWDMIASSIFIANSTIWAFYLIILPFIKKQI